MAAAPALPPGPRAPHPWQALRWVLRPEALLRDAASRFSEPFTVHLPFGPAVVVSDPPTVKRVFTGDPAALRAGEGNAVLEPAVGPRSVLLLDGSAHLRQRRLLLGPFHGEHLAAWEGAMAEAAAADVARWPRGTPFALEDHARAITLEVILRVVFGVRDAARLSALRALLRRLLPPGGGQVALLPAVRRDLGPLSPWGRFLAVRARIDALLHDEIARRRGERDLDGRDDVLSLLLRATDEQGAPMRDDELRDELVTLLLAGHETTTVALAWTVELLGRTPGGLERAAAHPAYLDAAIHESLRLRPPLPMVVRRLAAPFAVGGHELPAGTRLMPCIWLAHRRPELYPDPLAFRPERFLERPPETYAWLPFGGGIRRCVGAQFALNELRVVLTTILARVRLRPADGPPERSRRRAVVLAPAHGARVVAEHVS